MTILFRNRWHQRLHDRIVARLLWAANTRPPMQRREFYDLKDRLLTRYATVVGRDIQHIRKDCWNCSGTGEIENGGRMGISQCCRCYGTRVYREFYVYLSRWEFCGHIFHRPEVRTYSIDANESVTIKGYVKHVDLPGHIPTEAALWLALLKDRRLFIRMMKGGSCCAGWYWLPLCNVQRIMFLVRGFLSRFKIRRCLCGRRWMRLWNHAGHLVCRRCRSSRHCGACGRRLWPWRRHDEHHCSRECFDSVPF